MNKYQQQAKTPAQKWYWRLGIAERKAIQSKYSGKYFMGYQDDEFINAAYQAENTAPTTEGKEGLHTQLPWRIASQNYDTGFYVIHGIDRSCPEREVQVLKLEYGAHPIKEYLDKAKANAELIVKAVNNFERMKEALEWLIEGVDEGETIKGAKVMHAIAEATTILSQLNR